MKRDIKGERLLIKKEVKEGPMGNFSLPLPPADQKTGEGAEHGGGPGGLAAAMGRGKRERGPRGTCSPPRFGPGRSEEVGPRQRAAMATAALAAALGAGRCWVGRLCGLGWWLRSSEARQGPLYSRGKAVGRRSRVGGGPAGLAGRLNGVRPAARVATRRAAVVWASRPSSSTWRRSA